jgi:hypothetical protein
MYARRERDNDSVWKQDRTTFKVIDDISDMGAYFGPLEPGEATALRRAKSGYLGYFEKPFARNEKRKDLGFSLPCSNCANRDGVNPLHPAVSLRASS